MTWKTLLDSARRQAREHDAQAATILPAQWEAVLRALWPLVWAYHPESLHTSAGVLLGEAPDLPEAVLTDTSVIPLAPEWALTVGAGLAWLAMDALLVSVPEEMEAHRRRVSALHTRFERGLLGSAPEREG